MIEGVSFRLGRNLRQGRTSQYPPLDLQSSGQPVNCKNRLSIQWFIELRGGRRGGKPGSGCAWCGKICRPAARRFVPNGLSLRAIHRHL
jgi:hypothetical protein